MRGRRADTFAEAGRGSARRCTAAGRSMPNAERISRSWVVKNFMAGIDFFNKVAALAEEEGHHPDLHLEGYRNVSIVIWTHAVGGLTENDFILAAKINECRFRFEGVKSNAFCRRGLCRPDLPSTGAGLKGLNPTPFVGGGSVPRSPIPSPRPHRRTRPTHGAVIAGSPDGAGSYQGGDAAGASQVKSGQDAFDDLRPSTPVSLASSPWNLTLKASWSMPSWCSIVAWRSWTVQTFSTAA